MGILTHFFDLHELDWEIYQLTKDKKRLPEKLAKARKNIEQQQAQLAKRQDEHKQKQTYLREQETSLLAIENSISERQVRLNQSKDNREYTALLSEIADKKQQKDSLEENILHIMEENEQYKEKCHQQQQKIADLQKQYRELEQQTQQNLQEIEQQLQKLQERCLQKRVLIKDLDSNILEIYDRVLKSKSGKAMVPVEEEACGFCHIQLMANDIALLRSGKMVFCKECERLLYIPEFVNRD